MTTDECIAEMLTTSTGAHFLDSGGAYGRAWEHNQKAVGESGLTAVEFFRRQPRVKLEFWMPGEESTDCHPDITINVWHFLTESLGEYLEDETHKFWEWAEEPEQEDMYWPGLMEKWLGYDDMKEDHWGTINTYNGESAVSQTLQYCSANGKTALQIHGGCDVRGGYTAPRIFEADTWSEGYLRVADAMIFPEKQPWQDDRWSPKLFDVEPTQGHVGWYTDDTYNWYADAGWYRDLHSYGMTTDETKRGEGVVYVDDDRNGYCPVTGEKLFGDFCVS